jgi:hypothetical protein
MDSYHTYERLKTIPGVGPVLAVRKHRVAHVGLAG